MNAQRKFRHSTFAENMKTHAKLLEVLKPRDGGLWAYLPDWDDEKVAAFGAAAYRLRR